MEQDGFDDLEFIAPPGKDRKTYQLAVWNPIETAPKTGRAVLLYEGFEPFICEGYWGLESEEWLHSRGNFWRQPTHWMPLPAPPSVS